ncbi:sugar ABC transporter substrate-binding protein [Georgenia halophila]|uniref:Sugar ABC transporter substrate-binding protein n=1 Tax=Georgenia halophila TaxID=620889 RepID=A0ABP8KUY1_9MICO
MRITQRRGALQATALAGAVAVALAACGSDSGDGGGGGGGGQSPDDAAAEGGSLTVWAWEPTLESVVADYEEANPEVDIELVNAGTGNDQYTALQNAISAGSGVPDVAQIEYYALSQFSLAETVTDLSDLGAADLEGTFTPGPWSSVQSGEGIFGLPMDSGPMALFYNKTVFDEHNIEVPETWDQYVEAARKLQEADPNAYITSDTGDAGTTTSLIWQAGGQPYQVDGTTIGIDFTDEGSSQYAETWNTLVEEELVAPISGWTDEWYQGLADGTIATLAVGAWMPANLESGVASASGDWRVAPLPQWEEGANASAENGGSSLAVPAASENAALAYDFIAYATAEEGVQTRLDEGAFPATVEHMESEEFLNREFEYFGGQQANKIFAESASNVLEGWTYLPFQVYANSIYSDTVGQAYVSDTTIAEGLQAWQEASIDYAEEQGFTVE